MDLVELIATLRACSPNAALAAMVSALSPCGVDVPCALTYCTSAVLMPALRNALRMQRAAPHTSASPVSINGPASPMGWVAVAQAVTMARFGPFMPYRIDRFPEIMLMMLIGM